MEFDDLPRHSRYAHRHLSADEVRNHRTSAAIWYVHDLRCPGERFEQFPREMLDRARPGVPVGQLAGICFRISDELLEGVSRHRGVHGDAENIGGDAGNRIQILDRIIEWLAL